MDTKSNAPKEKSIGKLITPRGEEPIKGKMEEKENSWNPAENRRENDDYTITDKD